MVLLMMEFGAVHGKKNSKMNCIILVTSSVDDMKSWK
ncbi:unnamed protein product [Larinioides sclopetarius]|uniref:Uncharacterized protein n=1 Tax=Larinioides sclopetarius TaxID=280406 RepID=A0AAV2BS22_9ARAC